MEIDPNSSPLVALAFLSIFHTLGGVAVGLGLRSFVDAPSLKALPRQAFVFIWGGMFGCLPLFAGLESGPGMLLAQIAILLGVIILTYLLRDYMREAFSNSNIVAIALGGVFLLTGMVGGWMFLFGDPDEPQRLAALVFIGAFGLTGGAIFLNGIKGVWRGEEEGED